MTVLINSPPCQFAFVHSHGVRHNQQVLDENDNDPHFRDVDYSAHVSEDAAPGLSVLTVLADDRDDGANANVTYSLVANSDAAEPTPFSVDSRSGVIATSG